jgi:hypothetical protein
MQRGCGEVGDVVSQSIYAGQNYSVFLCRNVHCDLLFRIAVPQFWVDGQSFQFWVQLSQDRDIFGSYRSGVVTVWVMVVET